jgi:SAM-dependent methyltransferase
VTLPSRRLLVALHRPRLRTVIERIPIARRVYAGWRRQHPFDRLRGTDTGGFSLGQYTGGPSAERIFYVGSQPSIVATALKEIPNPASRHFIDVGCGKGRVLLVAADLPFAAITGVEVEETLAAAARSNVETALPDSERSRIRVVTRDVGAFEWPDGNLAVFMYHSVGPSLLTGVLQQLESKSADNDIFVVYYNPVWGQLLDDAAWLHRWYAETLDYSRDEVGYGTDLSDTVVIWTSNSDDLPHDRQRLRQIVPSSAGLSMVLADETLD